MPECFLPAGVAERFSFTLSVLAVWGIAGATTATIYFFG